MKLTIVIEVILVCIILTIVSIFTIDSVTVRKAELTSILATDVQDIVEAFCAGKGSAVDLQTDIENAITENSNTASSLVSTTLYYADANLGVVDILIEVEYNQPNGRPRLLSYRRTYIKEMPADPTLEDPYSFIRTINKESYKTGAGLFVPAIDGGLNDDSIWRTNEYAAVLDAVFAAEH